MLLNAHHLPFWHLYEAAQARRSCRGPDEAGLFCAKGFKHHYPRQVLAIRYFLKIRPHLLPLKKALERSEEAPQEPAKPATMPPKVKRIMTQPIVSPYICC